MVCLRQEKSTVHRLCLMVMGDGSLVRFDLCSSLKDTFVQTAVKAAAVIAAASAAAVV